MTQYYSRNDTEYIGSAIVSIPFSYIKKEDVSAVIIREVEGIETEIEASFTWSNASQITITTTLQTGDIISVRRNTPVTEKIVTYQNESMILDEDNLNLSQDQLLNAVQEMRDGNVTFQLDIDEAFEEYKNTVDGEIDTIDGKADAAIDTAGSALTSATSAVAISGSAMSTATSASEVANSAFSTAQAATTTANTAYSMAGSAVATSTEASTVANSALASATSATATANSALASATSATATASSALASATSADTKAGSAIATATEASNNASSAVATATSASQSASSAVADATTALAIATEASGKVDSFGEDIAAVIAAAEQIEALEGAVTTATQAATSATDAATSALASATSAGSAAASATAAATRAESAVPQQTGTAGVLKTNGTVSNWGTVSYTELMDTLSAGTGIDSTALSNGTIQTDTTIASKTDIGNGTIVIQSGTSPVGTITANQTASDTIVIPQTTVVSTYSASGTDAINGTGVANALTPYQLIAQSMTSLSASGTIALSDNTINKINATGSVTFTLPSVTDLTKFHQIFVQLSMASAQTIDLGTTYYFNSTAPDLSQAGTYNLYWEYDNTASHWVAGCLGKGSAS